MLKSFIPKIDKRTVDGPLDTISNDKDDIIIDAEDDIKHINIISSVPMSLIINKGTSRGDLAVLVFLCRGENNEIFTISHNYIVESDKDVDGMKLLPFYEYNSSITNKIAIDLIMKSSTSYITDLKFHYNKDEEYPFMIRCITNTEDQNIVFVHMKASSFSSMGYFDDFIINPYVNKHDIQVAAVEGAKDSISDIFNVDKVDSILYMAKSNVKNNVSIVFKFYRYTSKDKVESIKVLCNYGVEKPFPNKKFNSTIKDLEAMYTSDGDQYIMDFLFEVHIENLDKNFNVIKIYNKNGDAKLLLEDSDIISSMGDMIQKF